MKLMSNEVICFLLHLSIRQKIQNFGHITIYYGQLKGSYKKKHNIILNASLPILTHNQTSNTSQLYTKIKRYSITSYDCVVTKLCMFGYKCVKIVAFWCIIPSSKYAHNVAKFFKHIL
jgi:hypothetical protein